MSEQSYYLRFEFEAFSTSVSWITFWKYYTRVDIKLIAALKSV